MMKLLRMASFVKVVKEILNQYCETWSTSDSQQQFLKDDLGIPLEWLHEALVSQENNLHLKFREEVDVSDICHEEDKSCLACN